MQPIIGLTPVYSSENDIYYMGQFYKDAVLKAGGIPLELKLHEDIISQVDNCDGILFCGGADINPKIYGEENFACEKIDSNRDNFETNLFKAVITTKKPILAICRGFQLINCLLGGSLYQDLPTQYNTAVNHRPNIQNYHKVQIIKDTLLYNILKQDELLGNSYHHQGVKQLASCLTLNASCDGLCECYSLDTYPYLLGIQWHPEKYFNEMPEALKIFQSFIKASKK